MKQRIQQLTMCLVLLMPVIGISQIQQFKWANNYSDNNGLAEIKAMVTDPQGNVYVAGEVMGTFDLDPGPGTDTVDGTGGTKPFIAKFNTAGAYVWGKSFGGTMSDYVSLMAIDSNGDLVVAGRFFSNDFVVPGTSYTLSSQGLDDIYVCKFNSNGSLLWAREFGSQGNEYANGLSIDPSNNIIFVGNFMNTVDFNPSSQVNSLTAAGNSDSFICILNSNGGYVNAMSFNSLSAPSVYKVVNDTAGNIYLSGTFNALCDFDPSASTYTMVALGYNDFYVAKYTANLGFVWAKPLKSNASYEVLSTLSISQNGEVIITGHTDGTIDLDPSVSTASFTAVGVDTYICKWDSNGKYLWHRNFGNNLYDYINDLSMDSKGDFYLVGSFSNVLDIDPGPGVYNIGTQGFNSAFFLKLDANGTFNTAFALNSSSQMIFNKIETAGTKYYIGGGLTGTGDVNPFGPVDNRTSASGWSADMVLWQFDQCTTPSNPTLSAIAYTGCEGKTSTLSAVSGTATINWYATPNGTAVVATGTNFATPVLSAGVYTYYAEAHTCTVSMNRVAAQLTVGINPTVSVVANASVICVGEAVDIIASGADSYSWSTGATTASMTVTPANSVTYVVVGSTTLNCSTNATVSLLVNECTTLEEQNKQSGFLLFPSPSNGEVTIQSAETIHNVKVYNIAGTLMVSQNNDATIAKLQLENLPKGIYLVVLNNQPQLAKRIILE